MIGRLQWQFANYVIAYSALQKIDHTVGFIEH